MNDSQKSSLSDRIPARVWLLISFLAAMLLYIIIIGILGITIEKLIKLAERRLTSWQEKREI